MARGHPYPSSPCRLASNEVVSGRVMLVSNLGKQKSLLLEQQLVRDKFGDRATYF